VRSSSSIQPADSTGLPDAWLPHLDGFGEQVMSLVPIADASRPLHQVDAALSAVAPALCACQSLGGVSAGTAWLEVQVSPDGVVNDAAVKGTTAGYGPVADCAREALESYRFPSGGADDEARILYPIHFREPGAHQR